MPQLSGTSYNPGIVETRVPPTPTFGQKLWSRLEVPILILLTDIILDHR